MKYEKDSLLLMFEDLKIKGYNLSNYKFIQDLIIINLQEFSFESLTGALCKMGYTKTNDPIFRHKEYIQELWKQGRFEEIINHNLNCLLNEALILQKRFLVKNTI